jgi:hypothetical protein
MRIGLKIQPAHLLCVAAGSQACGQNTVQSIKMLIIDRS